MNNTKLSILTMYYEKHLLPSNIANALGCTPGYITQIIQTDSRYKKEKDTRKEKNRIKHNKQTAEIVRKKREEEKRLASFIKEQHNEASRELSYVPILSDMAYMKCNSSAYHTTKAGNIVIDSKLTVGMDVPKRINTKIFLPTQKYKKKYVFAT